MSFLLNKKSIKYIIDIYGKGVEYEEVLDNSV